MNKIRYDGRAVEESDGLSWFRASTNDVDRHGTVIEPRGIDTTNFAKNPVFLWGHDGYGSFAGPPAIENVLGRIADFRTTDTEFDVAVEWAEANPRAEMARNLVRSGVLNAVSIGFIPDASTISTKSVEYGADIPVYERTELVEVSLVPVPANPHAVALIRSMQREVVSPPSTGADTGRVLAAIRDMRTSERFRRALRPGR